MSEIDDTNNRLSREQIIASLEAQRADLLREIENRKLIRMQANQAIKEIREELANVDRLLKAAEGKRSRKPAPDAG